MFTKLFNKDLVVKPMKASWFQSSLLPLLLVLIKNMEWHKIYRTFFKRQKILCFALLEMPFLPWKTQCNVIICFQGPHGKIIRKAQFESASVIFRNS